MQLRKKIHRISFILAVLAIFSFGKISAQYMPVVYDKSYGENIAYQHACPTSLGEVALVSCEDAATTITWVKREGEVLFSRPLPTGFTSINNTYYIGDNKLLILGQSNSWLEKKKQQKMCGRAVVVDNTGTILTDIYMGGEGSELFCGEQLKDGNFIFGGYEVKAGGVRVGMLGKVDALGKSIYKYTSEDGGPCIGFDVLGSTTEYIHAAFTSEDSTISSVIRLNSVGKPVFVSKLSEAGFQIQKMVTAADDQIFLIGNSPTTGGRIIKMRTEGDIVFNKEIIPSSTGASLEYVFLANNGNVLTGGNGSDMTYYSLLRNDGTDLQKYQAKGKISGMGIDPVSGESVIVSFEADRGRGTIVGLGKDGRQLYQKATDGSFDQIRMTSNGIFLAESGTGRVCMLSNQGDLLFDRYAIEGSKNIFDDVFFTGNGDILLKDMKNRLIKLGHGIYVSDVKINKPVNGYTTALFSVTLTGYPTTDEGAPVPVKVEYATRRGTATEADNYSPVKGSLSFVPSNDGAARYMIKQEVEVPIKANNLMEGRKIFELLLANVDRSYLVKAVGVGTIEDQEVFVKMVNVKEGLEGQEDVAYELGIFKTSGEELINATGSDIIIDGIYGKGTADALDYDMGVIPQTIIARGARSGKFNVKTLNDTRYELPKTVVVDFNKIHAISDANINFEGTLLSCTGSIVDQPAKIAIHSLGDHGRMNNIVSGFFKISLLRSSDDAVLTNATGGDINVVCSIGDQTTGTEGKDFVLTNLHNLRIWGDGNRSAINLNGIVLYNTEKTGVKNLVMGIDAVDKPAYAPNIVISPTETSAGFSITE